MSPPYSTRFVVFEGNFWPAFTETSFSIPDITIHVCPFDELDPLKSIYFYSSKYIIFYQTDITIGAHTGGGRWEWKGAVLVSTFVLLCSLTLILLSSFEVNSLTLTLIRK